MGWLLPKKHLQWREPQDVRRSLDKLAARCTRRWSRPLFVAVIAGFMMLQWHLADSPTKPPALTALALAVVLGVFLVYLVPFLLRFLPRHVVVFDKLIQRSVGDHFERWQFKDIKGCIITTRLFNDKPVAVLAITKLTDDVTLIGIDPKVSLPELHDVLTKLGVRVEWERAGEGGAAPPGVEDVDCQRAISE